MGNTIGAIEQFRVALGNLTLITSVKCSTEVNFFFISKNGLFLHKLIECDEGLILCTVKGIRLELNKCYIHSKQEGKPKLKNNIEV